MVVRGPGQEEKIRQTPRTKGVWSAGGGSHKPPRNIDREKREVSASISEKIARTHVVFPLPSGLLQITFIGVAPTMSGRRLKMELLHRNRAVGCQFGNVVGDEDARVLEGHRASVWLVLRHAITVGNGVLILSGCGGKRVRKVRHARRERSGTGNWATGQQRGNSADNPIIQGKSQDMGIYEEGRARAQFM